jgi:hypothetical protein
MKSISADIFGHGFDIVIQASPFGTQIFQITHLIHPHSKNCEKHHNRSFAKKLPDDDLRPNLKPFEWCCKCTNFQVMNFFCA